MPLQATASAGSAVMHRADGDLTVVYPSTENDYRTIFKIPAGSMWQAAPHWHERYTEFLRVRQGRILIVIDGKSRIVRAEDGVQVIDKYAVHSWMRADAAEEDSDVGDAVVEEYTDPADGLKEVFFRNIFSTILQANSSFGRTTSIQIGVTSTKFDNFDVYLPGRFAWIATHTIKHLFSAFGWLLGLKPWYKQFTPERLHPVAASGGRPSNT